MRDKVAKTPENQSGCFSRAKALFTQPSLGDARIPTLDALRGLASFAVAWFHFTQGSPIAFPALLKASGAYGWAGVQMFFVISGFVIPHALQRAKYSGKDFSRFVQKP
jgi:peptidoglycan/LPS O-acetylase OafA/YrhL